MADTMKIANFLFLRLVSSAIQAYIFPNFDWKCLYKHGNIQICCLRIFIRYIDTLPQNKKQNKV